MNDRLSALIDATAAMWPAPAVVEHVSVRHRSVRQKATHESSPTASDRVLVQEYLLLPNAKNPKLALPSGAPRAARAALRKHSQDLTFKARATRALAARAVGYSLVNNRLPDRIRVTAPAGASVESLESHLQELLGQEIVLSFGVGNARANRKPVLQILTPAGETVAFAKLGTTPVSRELVEGEARALGTYWTKGAPEAHVEVPRIVHTGSWHDTALLVMTPLQAKGAPDRHQRAALPVEAMTELSLRFGTTKQHLGETSFWQGIRAVPELQRFADRHGDERLELGAWHGDWTPWNMAWEHERVLLWDFERFATGVPLGMDAAHYTMQTVLRTEGESAAETLVKQGKLAAEELTAKIYLLELARRWVLASAPEEGKPLRKRTSWLLRLLGEVYP